MIRWRRTVMGSWTALAGGKRLSIQRYRAWDKQAMRWRWSYVARINGTALESPARAYPTMAAAKLVLIRELGLDSPSTVC